MNNKQILENAIREVEAETLNETESDLKSLYKKYSRGSSGFIKNFDWVGAFDISDNEAERIANKAKTASQFEKIWQNEDWWKDGMNEGEIEADELDDELDDEEDEDEIKNYKFSKKKKKIDESILASLFEGSNIPQSFIEEAGVIFNSILEERIAEEVDIIAEHYQEESNRVLVEQTASLIEKMNLYLENVVENWFEENEIAIESGIVQENNQNIVEEVKEIFDRYGIDLSEGGYNQLDELREQNEILRLKNNELLIEKAELREKFNEKRRKEIIEESCRGLAYIDKKSIIDLVETVDFDGTRHGEEKLRRVVDKLRNSLARENDNNRIGLSINEETPNFNDTFQKDFGLY